MTTHLPPALQKLLKVTVGMPWPEGSEGDLRELAWQWEVLAGELDSLSAQLMTAAGQMSTVMEGETSESIQNMLSGPFREGAGQLEEQAWAYSKMLKNAAADIQKTKIMIIAMLGILAASLAALFASLFGSFAAPAVIALNARTCICCSITNRYRRAGAKPGWTIARACSLTAYLPS